MLFLLFLAIVMAIVFLIMIEALIVFWLPGFSGLMVGIMIILISLFFDSTFIWIPTAVEIGLLLKNSIVLFSSNIVLAVLVFLKYLNYELIEGV